MASPYLLGRAMALAALLAATGSVAGGESLRERNEEMFRQMAAAHGYTEQQVDAVRAIFARSGFAGQGNPAVTVHPMAVEDCRQRRGERLLQPGPGRFAEICGGPYLAPLYDPEKETPEQARVCIDQFEFPDLPCAYPVVWIRASEAAAVCQAVGKRLCDAHEWEGACAGQLLEPDYRFDLARGVAPGAAVARMRAAHNKAAEGSKRWSYGPGYRTGICAGSGRKTAGCQGEGWARCGSNTFPAGAFPDCKSPLEVYDLNGNAAEHMNLPLEESQMASRGSRELGYTEMKGSWFIFDTYAAHEDWCRWRAPFWHGGKVMDPRSHANYHLGFRCCKDVGKR